MTTRAYDFRNPERPASDLEQFLAQWLRAAAQLAAERWDRTIAAAVGLKFQRVETVAPARLSSRIPQGCFGFRLRAEVGPGAGCADTLLVWSRRAALGLFALAMGTPPAEWPDDRELSAVEISIGEYLVQSLFGQLLQSTWPQSAGLELRVAGTEPTPRLTRLFAEADEVHVCTGSFTAPFGEQAWHWLVPVPGRLAEAVELGAEPRAAHPGSVPLIEALLPDMRVEVVVRLGSGEVSLSHLGSLRPGDLLVLDQKATDPLPVHLNGARKWHAWPGRVGSRQAVQIESPHE